jgi:hypothetical protein
MSNSCPSVSRESAARSQPRHIWGQGRPVVCGLVRECGKADFQLQLRVWLVQSGRCKSPMAVAARFAADRLGHPPGPAKQSNVPNPRYSRWSGCIISFYLRSWYEEQHHFVDELCSKVSR